MIGDLPRAINEVFSLRPSLLHSLLHIRPFTSPPVPHLMKPNKASLVRPFRFLHEVLEPVNKTLLLVFAGKKLTTPCYHMRAIDPRSNVVRRKAYSANFSSWAEDL